MYLRPIVASFLTFEVLFPYFGYFRPFFLVRSMHFGYPPCLMVNPALQMREEFNLVHRYDFVYKTLI